MGKEQIKSKERVTEHGEVFTNEREVNAMLDLVKDETERIESRFLGPACGDGNFLIEILRRKLAVVKRQYGRSRSDYEKYSILALSSIYGVDIMEDNAAECRKRLFRNQNGTWTCKSYHCGAFEFKATDQMILSAVLNMLNSAIANPSLLDVESEMSVYTPDGEILKQNNEISRLMESPDIEYDRVKSAILQLAQMKYNCCTYNDIPQKTELLKKQLSDKKQQNTIDIELLKNCAEYITVSHNATIGLELINGVRLNNITERSREIGSYNDTSG